MCPLSEHRNLILTPEIAEYSPEERRTLLRLAHESIAAAFEQRTPDLTPPNGHLAEPHGAFTTLHLEGRLRGCIGYVAANQSLYRTVAETARGAAFDDPRFTPLTRADARRLKIDISVLSALQPIAPEDVVPGKHGLVVIHSGHRGLLLPQVPVEWGWDREAFLAQTCLKAGLPPDAWAHGAQLQAFTAEVFGDE